MLGETLPYKPLGKDKNSLVRTDLYSFKCTLNITYIVEIEHHPNDVYIIKFFQKNHRFSKNRYSLLNTEGFLKRNGTNGARNFLIILNTVTSIIITIYKENKNASFGFIGSPTKREKGKENIENVNPDGTVANTKRYNTYGIYVKRYFSPDTFEHIEIETSSAYLIKNRRNLNLTTDRVESFFEDYIRDHC